MEKESIEKMYNNLVDVIEKIEMFENCGGMSRYKCIKCGCKIHTVHKDKGIPYFMIKCARCGSMMYRDAFAYRMSVKDYTVIGEWYRPSLEETFKLNESEISHILNGGLLLEKNQK